MRRREFIRLIARAAVAWPLGAHGLPAKKIPKVGVLWHAGSAAEEAIYLRALNQGFSSLGYVDGKSIVLVPVGTAGSAFNRLDVNKLIDAFRGDGGQGAELPPEATPAKP